jgi:hypothetical protein
MTLRDIERSIYRRLNKNASVPNAETQARVREFINSRHRMLMRKFPQLRDDVLTFASVASQQRYGLPEQGIARINRIWETTNDRTLELRDLSWLRTNDPDPQTSTPCAWIPLSYTQVHTQPSNASEVFVDSTSASDTCRAFIEGVITGGYRRKAEVTMTGTTAVSLDTTITTWIQIDKFYLSEEAVGTVTLHEDASGGTELSQIAIGDTYAKFLSFLLWPTPSDVITYTCDITRSITEMDKPTDEPLLPVDFHDLLCIGARLDEYEHTDDSRRTLAEVEWDEGVKALTSWIVAHPSTRIDLNGAQAPGRSRLGGWYPAGT